MLILTRKSGESIVLGENIEIKVLDVYEGRVKIGVDAPRDVRVLRREVFDAIEENKAAINNPVGKDELSALISKVDD